MPEIAFSLTTRPGVTIRGHKTDPGIGPVGLFLHGFRSDSGGQKSLDLAAHAEARGRAWIRFDLAGHGASGGRFSDQTLSDWLGDARAVAALAGPRPLLIVGSSLGAWLAVLMAQAAAFPIAGLVLLAPAFNFLQRYYATLPPALQDRWRTEGRLSLPDPYGPADAVYSLDYRLIEDAARHDVLGGPVRLACPIVMIHGDRDEAVPLSVSHDFLAHAQAPAKRLLVVPGGDHRLTAALPAIREAVDGLWPAPADRRSQAASC